MKKDFEFLRNQMVESQLMRRHLVDPKILDVFRKIPRHLFVLETHLSQAYEDHPIPIGFEQTISQPYIVALMTQCMAPKADSRILEVGTGSGYQTAVLAELCGSVYSVERICELSARAEKRLRELGYRNIFFKCGNGAEGWDASGPYDGILVSCASRTVPTPLLSQLKEGGRVVIPLGGSFSQVLTVLRKHHGSLECREICGCAFVPLIEKGSAA
ncbi:MAG: protein-L-isoaspartate(D-aspartate) O-methyltransferase [Candidatus Omnitrophota bacterium]